VDWDGGIVAAYLRRPIVSRGKMVGISLRGLVSTFAGLIEALVLKLIHFGLMLIQYLCFELDLIGAMMIMQWVTHGGSVLTALVH
jgi:hypothetical protein